MWPCLAFMWMLGFETRHACSHNRHSSSLSCIVPSSAYVVFIPVVPSSVYVAFMPIFPYFVYAVFIPPSQRKTGNMERLSSATDLRWCCCWRCPVSSRIPCCPLGGGNTLADMVIVGRDDNCVQWYDVTRWRGQLPIETTERTSLGQGELKHSQISWVPIIFQVTGMQWWAKMHHGLHFGLGPNRSKLVKGNWSPPSFYSPVRHGDWGFCMPWVCSYVRLDAYPRDLQRVISHLNTSLFLFYFEKCNWKFE